jgi:hypothetical protein
VCDCIKIACREFGKLMKKKVLSESVMEDKLEKHGLNLQGREVEKPELNSAL